MRETRKACEEVFKKTLNKNFLTTNALQMIDLVLKKKNEQTSSSLVKITIYRLKGTAIGAKSVCTMHVHT